MLIETTLVAIVVSLLLGGSLKKFGEVKIDKLILPYIAFVLELGAGAILHYDLLSMKQLVYRNTFFIELIVYLLLFLFIFSNFRFNGFKILFIGMLLNFIVIMANKGFMPVDVSMAYEYNFDITLHELKNDLIFAHEIMTDNSRLKILSDWIKIKPPYPFPKTISIGDLFIDIGISWFILKTMGALKRIKNII